MMNRHVEMDYHLVLLYVCLTVNMSKNSTKRDDERDADVNSTNNQTNKNGKDKLNKDLDAVRRRKCRSCNDAPMSHNESNESILDEDLYGTSHKYLANLEILRAKLNLVRLDGDGEGKNQKSSTNVDDVRVSSDGQKLTKKKSIFAVTSEQANVPNLTTDNTLESESYYKLLDEEFNNEEDSYCWSATFRNNFSLETIPEVSGNDADLESFRTSTTDSYTPPRKKMCARSNSSINTPSCMSIPCSVIEYYSYKSDDSSHKSDDVIEYRSRTFDETLCINLPSSICDSASSTETTTSVEQHLTIIENEECSSNSAESKDNLGKTYMFNQSIHSNDADDSSDSGSNENNDQIQIPILTRRKAVTDIQNVDSKDIILENVRICPNSTGRKVKKLQVHNISNEYNIRSSAITQCDLNLDENSREVCTATSFLDTAHIYYSNLKSPKITFGDDYKSEEFSFGSTSEGSCEELTESSISKHTTPLLLEEKFKNTAKTSLPNTKSDSFIVSKKTFNASKFSQIKSAEFDCVKASSIKEKEENLEPFLGSLEVPKMTANRVSPKIGAVQKGKVDAEEANISFYLTASMTIPQIFSTTCAFPALTKIATLNANTTNILDVNAYLKEQNQEDEENKLKDSNSKAFVSYKTVASELIIKSKTDIATSSALTIKEARGKSSSKSIVVSRKLQSTDIDFYTVPSPVQSHSENESKNEPPPKSSTPSDSDSIGKNPKICSGCFFKKLFFTRRRKRFFS